VIGAFGCFFVAVTGLSAASFDAKTQSQLPAEWKTVDGSWKVSDGRLVGSPAKEAAEAMLELGSDELRDVSIEVELAFSPAKNASRWFGLLVRDGGEAAPGVQLTVRADTGKSNGLEIATKQTTPPGWRVLQGGSTQAGFQDGKSHRVRVEAAGTWIRGYIDDKLVIRSCRGDEFAKAGRAAIRLSGGGVMIDRINVQTLEAPADPAAIGIRTRPMVIGHRGLSFVAPENTLASYKLAMKTGADMAECDVYLSKDGVPILLHDRTFKRTTGRDAAPGELTLAEIKKLDAGKWKAPEFAGEPVPTLQEALTLVKGNLRLVIEIKEPTIAPAIVKCLKDAAVEPQDVMIFSFHDKAVEEIAKLEPHLPTTWLVDNPGVDETAWRATINRALEMRVSNIGTSYTHVDPGFVKLAHACGFGIFVWTVNEPSDMSYLVRVGVDGIISDRPDLVISVLEGKNR
jgi:glycerophosphoryl diester phosphodiesterase